MAGDVALRTTPTTQSPPETISPSVECQEILLGAMAQFLNETNAGIDSQTLLMLVGSRSPLLLEFVGLATSAELSRWENGGDAGNHALSEGVIALCERDDVQAELLADVPAMPVADFVEGSDEYRCVPIVLAEVTTIGFPAPSMEALEAALRDWTLMLGTKSPLTGPLSRTAAAVVGAQIEQGQRDAWPVAGQLVNDLCADAYLARESLRLAGEVTNESEPVRQAAPDEEDDVESSQSFDNALIALESSSDAPANDVVHVAEQIVTAVHNDDEDALAVWADFPQPEGLAGQLDVGSLVCDVDWCELRTTDDRSVRLVLSYSDRGWYGVALSLSSADDVDADVVSTVPTHSPVDPTVPTASSVDPTVPTPPDGGCDEGGVGVLRRGDGWCHSIELVQTWLNAWGYVVDVDGFFGPGTEGAVAEFQFDQYLVVDGLVGPETWYRLSEVESWDS